MLVVSRKKGETVVIAIPGMAPIRVQLVEIRGDRAHIGIEAPKNVPVHRDEVWAAIQQNAQPSPATTTGGTRP